VHDSALSTTEQMQHKTHAELQGTTWPSLNRNTILPDMTLRLTQP